MSNPRYSPDAKLVLMQPCPLCGHPLNAVGEYNAPHANFPAPGDATVCIACAGMLIFGALMELRPAKLDEIDADLRQVQQDILKMHTIMGVRTRPKEELL